jgi:glycosyltransferase involved in cell wall biosynthesis
VTPLVSVWMPSYNHASYLPAAIESVLAQTLHDWELVIVDDGSHDGSLEIAERYAAAHPDRITVLTHPGHANLGAARTGQLCRSRLRGTFMLGLPSDDVLYPDALERQASLLGRNPGTGYVYGYAHLVDDRGQRLPGMRAFGYDLTRGGRLVERLVQTNHIPAMTVMLRRECLRQAGEEDETLVYSDWELWVRAAAHWDVKFNPRPVAMYRVHGANTGFNIDHDTNLERSIEITSALRERAERVGGRLAEARVRATLELQLSFQRFAAGDPSQAAVALAAAFDRDPSLADDARWLGDWLSARLIDPLLPADRQDLAPWLTASVLPLLGPRASRRFRREARAAEHEVTAIRLSRSGQAAGARRAAAAAVRRSPRRLGDRRLVTAFLDSIGGGSLGQRLRVAKRRLLGYR